jgi:uncharacterized membrane protein
MNPHASGSLEEQVTELRWRVRRLEEALYRSGIPVQQAPARPSAEQAAKTATSPPAGATVHAGSEAAPALAAAPIEPPRFGTPAAGAPSDVPSLETRIGSQWFNRLGILAVLIGMAWFLKFAIDNNWIGPLGRVLIGLVAGAGFIAWSERFRNKGYAVFSYSLKAVGSGILYLSLWAAFSFYHLVPGSVAFAAMILVTAFNGFMAWAQDAELLALYAIVGGLVTPVLISTGENHETALLSYLLLLNLAALVLVALRPWSRLLFGAFLGTMLLFVGWWSSYYTDAQSARTAFFLACFFLIFALAPRLARVDLDDSAHISGWDTLALVLLPIANAAIAFLGFYAIFNADSSEWAGPWLAVGFAAFYLALLRLPASGRLHASPAVLSSIHLTAAVVFLTIAIPLKTQGRWLTIGWLAEGAALLWMATRLRSTLLRVLALICLAMGLIALLTINPSVSATPIFNQRFGTYCAAIAVFAFAAWLSRPTDGEERFSQASPALAATAGLTVNALILIAICLEIHSYWSHRSWNGGWRFYHDHRMYAQFTYSAFLMAYGAILLAVGFWRRTAFLRWQALVLLAVSIAKVFLVDVSELSQGYRIVSFLGLGVLLLGTSFAYQRDWLNLRGTGRRTQ